MIKLRLDDAICELEPSGNIKIEEAINSAISTIPPTRVITRVNVNGARYQSTEKNSILQESTKSSHDIEILTADKAIWAATGYDIALSSIERVQRSVIRSAELFREFDNLNGNRLLVQCIEGLERFIEAITITKRAVGLDFSKINVDGMILSQIESNLQQILNSVFNLQEKEDYQELADTIEYELLTNLVNWTQALTQLRTEQNSNT
ncbi:MAG: hypothetical protein HQ462_10575 [Deltaproteobacteria bacterium]|nr:hypothetical protein [Deltaproteobacteria bacterium]